MAAGARSRFLGLALSLGLSLAAAQAQAQTLGASSLQVDPDQPVTIAADTLEIIERENLALFSGEVALVQGDLKISAPIVRVTYGASDGTAGSRQIDMVEAPDGATVTSSGQTVEGGRLVYRLGSRMVEITGGVRIEQDGSTLLAEQLVLDIDAGTVVMRGGEGGQVRAVLGQEN